MEILSFSTLPSTNAHALELAANGARSGTVVWALSQSSGRGQYGRQFFSPVGGLYFSLILQPDLPPERLSLVTLAAGVGCCVCLENHFTAFPLLKWPNDLYLNGRKLGGILTESLPLTRNHPSTVIVGVGLNINTTVSDIPKKLRSSTTSLIALTKQDIDLLEILQFLVAEIITQVNTLKEHQDKLLAQWNTRDYLKKQSVIWDNGRLLCSGYGQGILPDGRYSMRDVNGILHSILSGTLKPSITPHR